MTTRTGALDTIPRHGHKQNEQMLHIDHSTSHEKVADALLDQIRWHFEHTDASTLRSMLERMVHNEPQESADHAVNVLVDNLSQGRKYSPEETLTMELELLGQAFELRRKLLNGALTTIQVAQLLGTRRQTPHDRVRSGTLLGVEENGRWLFPYWQFDPTGPNGVVSGLPEILRALQISALAKANWLTLPNPYLEGRSPLQALKAGEVERVVDIARAVGAN